MSFVFFSNYFCTYELNLKLSPLYYMIFLFDTYFIFRVFVLTILCYFIVCYILINFIFDLKFGQVIFPL
jgi:hypothetical protein